MPGRPLHVRGAQSAINALVGNNVLVGNIHGAHTEGHPTSKKDRHDRFRVDYKRRVIVEARYLSAQNHLRWRPCVLAGQMTQGLRSGSSTNRLQGWEGWALGRATARR